MPGNWIQTFTGQRVAPLDPDPAMFELQDIAHSLANQCRFTGHTNSFYSVAQHSVLVSQNCDPADALSGLMHDASEAYLVDLARPVKHDPRMAFFREAEDRLQRSINSAFGLPLEIPESVHVADRRLLLTERRDLLKPLIWTEAEKVIWDVADVPYEFAIKAWTPQEAETRFLTRYLELTRSRNATQSGTRAVA